MQHLQVPRSFGCKMLLHTDSIPLPTPKQTSVNAVTWLSLRQMRYSDEGYLFHRAKGIVVRLCCDIHMPAACYLHPALASCMELYVQYQIPMLFVMVCCLATFAQHPPTSLIPLSI